MGYPFKLSKGSLRSVGSPHTWPQLSAALAWMVELLVYGETTFDETHRGPNNKDEEKFNDNGNENSNKENANKNGNNNNNKSGSGRTDEERLFLDFLAQNYSLWLSGVQDDDQVDATIINNLSTKKKELEMNVEKFVKANQQLLNEYNRLKKESPSIDQLTEERETLLQDKGKFIEYLKTIKSKEEEYINKRDQAQRV